MNTMILLSNVAWNFSGILFFFFVCNSLYFNYNNIEKKPCPEKKKFNFTLKQYFLNKTYDTFNIIEKQIDIKKQYRRPGIDIPLVVVGITITAETPESRLNTFRSQIAPLKFDNFVLKLFFVMGYTQNINLSKDVVVLDIHENLNDGKTFAWFEYAYKMFSNYSLGGVFKSDTDCFVNWTKFSIELVPYLKEPEFYIGNVNDGADLSTSEWYMQYQTNYEYEKKICRYYSDYFFHKEKNFFMKIENFTNCWTWMSGGFYGVSFHVLSKIMACNYVHDKKKGHEDVMTSVWVLKCAPSSTILHFLNGHVWCHKDNLKDEDFYQLKISPEACTKW